MRVTRKRTKRIKSSRKALLGHIAKSDKTIAELISKLALAESNAAAYKGRWNTATRDIERLRKENMRLKEQVFNLQGFKAKFQRSAHIDG